MFRELVRKNKQISIDERKLTTKHDRKVLASAKAEFAAEQTSKEAPKREG